MKNTTSSCFIHLTAHKEVVELLINKGADVNSKSENGCAPLHLVAIFCKWKKKCSRSKKLEMENKRRWFKSFFHFLPDNRDIAHMLIDVGATIDLKDGYGATPLLKAVYFGMVRVVELLNLLKDAIIFFPIIFRRQQRIRANSYQQRSWYRYQS